MNITSYKAEILQADSIVFNDLALWAFHYQYENIPVYKRYVDLLQLNPHHVKHITEIPFLPISLFKTQTILDSAFRPSELHYFESSSTTGQTPSKHYMADISLYENTFLQGFRQFFGEVSDYCILGLLPSYLERGHSSLVYMVNRLIKESNHLLSGFYLHNKDALLETLQTLENQRQKTLLFGVTFALLDFVEQFDIPLQHVQIIETGGMKGRREEWNRTRVHDYLKAQFHLPEIYSEYGMTELLSQAYSKGQELFACTAGMKVIIRELNDPLYLHLQGKGAINIIDLANIHSCCFIATDDMGELYTDGRFTVQGRIDESELRGCSLLTV